jgi:hypothetical protein
MQDMFGLTRQKCPKNLLNQRQSGLIRLFLLLHNQNDLEGRVKMSEAGFDARDFGKLEAQVEALQKEVHQLSMDVKSLLELANKSKGGFWMGMSIASAAGGVITFIATRIFK